MVSRPELNVKLHPDYLYLLAELVWVVENEMARTVEDVLARRIRMLFLDAEGACKLAPSVAEAMG